MPAFATHQIFGQECLEGMFSGELTHTVLRHKTVFYLGCQGPDIFFFNPFLMERKGKVGLGSRMHRSRTNDFFQVYLNQLLKLDDPWELEVGISYLLGFLTHYTLDCTLHPYVYSRTGYTTGDRDSASQTMPLHQRLEAVMDMQILMAKRERMPSAYYPERKISLTRQELSVVAGLLSRTIRKVYRVMLTVPQVKLSYLCLRIVMRLVYDHSGKKTNQIRRLESLIFRHALLGDMMVSDDLTDEIDVMNRQGTFWSSPWDKDRFYDSSVWELYDNAGERYQNYFEKVSVLLLGMKKRMQLLTKRQSRAEYIAHVLSEQIPETVEALENRNYRSGNRQ